MSELTDAAKAEIAEAVRIVREDKQHAMLRDIHTRTSPPSEPEPTKDPAKDPEKSPTPPPAKDPVEPPENKKSGLWWGDRLS